jgi:hypothetical protein
MIVIITAEKNHDKSLSEEKCAFRYENAQAQTQASETRHQLTYVVRCLNELGLGLEP